MLKTLSICKHNLSILETLCISFLISKHKTTVHLKTQFLHSPNFKIQHLLWHSCFLLHSFNISFIRRTNNLHTWQIAILENRYYKLLEIYSTEYFDVDENNYIQPLEAMVSRKLACVCHQMLCFLTVYVSPQPLAWIASRKSLGGSLLLLWQFEMSHICARPPRQICTISSSSTATLLEPRESHKSLIRRV